ncbi:hypothetical protein [Micromonospora radicis]|uniref:hypothetical protein n=1 Tax=Micromonospora radicis TaxID=1894971 RepID=UPI001314FD15|nr:hypothetical protein [Micromonospora radicis]
MTDNSPEHIPAHVKNTYVNCSAYTRAPQLTPPPAGAFADSTGTVTPATGATR